MTENMKRLAIYGVAGAAAGLAAWQILGRKRQDDLHGQVAVITGGSRGLGLQLAHEFAAAGCRLALCARDSGELDVARAELQAKGAQVLTVQCDVSQRDQVERFIRDVIARYGRLDILVTNAGIIQVGPIETMKLEDFEQAMNVMFWGVLYPIWSALPYMTEQKRGRIVTITSIGGKVSVPHLVPYSCAKFAAVALSEGLRTELRPKGIEVLPVVPGLMRTGSFLNALFKGNQEQEFGWFSAGASLPGISMDAEQAASQIVKAVRGGASEAILGVPAQLLARVHGAFPELSQAAMALVNRFLPGAAGGSTESVPGSQVEGKVDSPLYRLLTVLGRIAAQRLNERMA